MSQSYNEVVVTFKFYTGYNIENVKKFEKSNFIFMYGSLVYFTEQYNKILQLQNLISIL